MTEPTVDEDVQDQQDAQKLDEEHIAEVTKKRRGRPRKCKEITQENAIKEEAATSTDQAGIGSEKSRNSDSQDMTSGDGNQKLLEFAASSAKKHQAIEQGFGVKKKRERPRKQNVTSGDDSILLPAVTAGTKTNQEVEQGCKLTKKRGRPRKQDVISGDCNKPLPEVALGSSTNLQDTEQDLGLTRNKGRSQEQDVTYGDCNQPLLEAAPGSQTNNQETEQDLGLTKKKGRPRKQDVTSKNCNQPLPEVTPESTMDHQKTEQGLGVTKKRGTPRKQDVTSENGNQPLAEVAPESTMNHQKTQQDLGVTKNRGRPRKQDVTSENGNQPLAEVAPESTMNQQKTQQDLGVTKNRGRPRKQDVTSGDVNQPLVTAGTKTNQKVEQGCKVTKKRGRPRKCKQIMKPAHEMKTCPDKDDTRAGSKESCEVTNSRGKPFPEVAGSSEKLDQVFRVNEQGTNKDYNMLGCSVVADKMTFPESTPEGLIDVSTTSPPLMSPMASPALSTTNDAHLSVKTSRTDAEKGTNGRKRRRTSTNQKSMEAAELQVAQKRRKINPGCICQFCEKSFSSAVSRLRHENLHTGYKPYKCDMCFEAFSNATYLKRHTDKVHGSIGVKKETKLRKDRDSKSGPKPVVAIGEDDTCTNGGFRSDNLSKQKNASSTVIADDDRTTNADTTEKSSHPQNTVKEKDNSMCFQEGNISLKAQKSRRGRPRKLQKKSSISIGGTSSVSQQAVESSIAPISLSTTGADVIVARSKDQNQSGAKTTALAQKKQVVAEKQQVGSTMASVSSSTSGAVDRGTTSKECKQSSVEASALSQRELQVGEKQQKFDHTYTRLRPGKLKSVPNNLRSEAVEEKTTPTTTSSIEPTMKPLENSKEDGTPQMEVTMAQKLRRSTSSRHTCQYCKKIFYSSWNRTRHERLHTELKPYKCMQCGEAFSNSSYLKRHVKRIHGKCSVKKQVEKQNGKLQRDQETGAKYVKPVAQRTTTNVTSNATTRNVEPSLKILKESKRKITKQLSDTKKGKKPKESNSSSRTCQYCKKVLYSSYTRIRHESLHTGIKPYKCMQCAKAFSSEEHLKWHVKRFHEACSVKRQVQKQNRKPHKEQESDVKNGNALKDLKGVDASIGSEQRCICQFCKKVFSNFAVHRRHERLHTGQKLYKCKWCAEAFANGIYLPRHMGEVHDGADEKSKEPKQMKKTDEPTRKPLENSNKDDIKHIVVSMDTKKQKKLKRDTSSSRTCQYCKKIFYSSWSRIRHERLHTGIKPYKCMQCTEAFSNGEYLKWHMKRFHEACSVKKQVGKQSEKQQKDQETKAKHGKSLDASVSGSSQSCICQFCKKVFSKVGNCRRHERLHTGQKPYKCKWCAEAFANGTYLQLHVGKVHKGAAEKSKEGKQIMRTQKKEKKRVRFDLVSGQKVKGKDVNPEKTASTISQDIKPKCNSKHSKIISKQKQHQDTKDVQPQVKSKRNISKQKVHKNQDTKDDKPQVDSKRKVSKQKQLKNQNTKNDKPQIESKRKGSKQKQHKNQDTKDVQPQVESKGNVSKQKHHQRPGVCHFCKKVFTRVEYCMEHENSFHMGLKPYKCLLCGAAFGLSSSIYKHKKKCVGDGTRWMVLGLKDTKLSLKKVSDVCKTSSTLRKVGEEKTPLSLSQQTHQNFQQKESSTCGKKNKTNNGLVLAASSRKQNQDKILQKRSQLKIKKEHCNGMSSLPQFNQNGEPSSNQNDVTAQHPIVSSVHPTKDAKRSTKIVKKCSKREKLHSQQGGKQSSASKTIFPVAKSSQAAKRKSCSFCGKVFPRNKTLIHEKAVHLRLKLYPCPWCDKKYSWPHDLNRHKKTHKEVNTNPVIKQEKENYNERREKEQIQPKAIDSGGQARSKTDKEIAMTDMPFRRVKEAKMTKTLNSSSSGQGALTRVVQTQSSSAMTANSDNSRASNTLSGTGKVQKPEQTSSAQYESSCESHVDDNFDVENWFEDENNNADDVSQTMEKDTFQITNITNYAPVCHEEMNESTTNVVGNRSVPVLRSNTTKFQPTALMSNLENDDTNVNKDKVASATPTRVNEKGLCDVASLDGTESIAVEKGSVPNHNHNDPSESTEIRDKDCSGTNYVYVVQVNLSQKYSVVIMCEPSAETKTLVGKGEDKQDKGSNTMAQNSEMATFTSDESGEEMYSPTGEKSVAAQSEADADIIMLETEKQPSTPLTPPWTCEVCSVVFDSRIPFVYHQRIHDGDGVMNGRAALWTMPEGVYSEFYCSPEGLYKCSFCSSVFTQERQLKSHNFIHARNIDKPFGCPQCGGQYRLYKDWVTHMECHRNHKYLCKHCNRSFNVVKNWWRHELSHLETIE